MAARNYRNETRKHIAWALMRPDLTIVTNMNRATRQEVFDALRDPLIADQVADAWPVAYRRGFRAVRVRLEPVDVSPDFNGG